MEHHSPEAWRRRQEHHRRSIEKAIRARSRIVSLHAHGVPNSTEDRDVAAIMKEELLVRF